MSSTVERPSQPPSRPLPILNDIAPFGPLETKHFRRFEELPFTQKERGNVTILIGGLTLRHEELVIAGFASLGYRVSRIPTPTKADFQSGKEFGNNGQCSPTYFTSGALVNYLRDLRDNQGKSREEILNHYLFFTAGACGPCRFGMYEAEYRLALRNSGFEGFRVQLFQQRGGLNQAQEEAGIELNVPLFMSLLNALFVGDLLNELAYQIRPYELEPGSTDDALRQCIEIVGSHFRTQNWKPQIGWFARMVGPIAPGLNGADDVALFQQQLFGRKLGEVMHQCYQVLNAIRVDFLKAKPIVKITGEFWAQTTEGDGNFRMFSFLESEGAEVLVEPIATWINYMIHQGVQECRDRRGVPKGELPPHRWNLPAQWKRWSTMRSKLLKFYLADRIMVREYNRLRRSLGGTTHTLANQLELQRMGHPYYHSRARGGEGHLEVAKNIYYAHHSLAHMVLSVKPFGCMPSTQSDGAQAAVVSHYPTMLYLPIETSGEGDINAYGRVQMTLSEAKGRAKKEFDDSVRRIGFTLEQVQEFVQSHPKLRTAIQNIPQSPGIVGRGANFALHIGSIMNRAGVKKGGVHR